LSLESVFRELMFQKSLLVEGEERYREIDRYLQIAQSMPDADHHSIKDPFDRSIAIAFELVIAHEMDPGAIDIVSFSKLYLERIRKEGYVNFIVAGKLIFLAWNVLRLESEKLVSAFFEEEQELDPDFFYVFDEDPSYYVPDVEITPAVRAGYRREVNIMDLLDAFAEAQKEIEAHLKRASRITVPPLEFRDTAHREDAERDINMLFEKLLSMGPGPVALSDIASGKEEVVTSFLSMLFLTRLGKIKAWQENPPSGEIYMEIISPTVSVELDSGEKAGQET
jgi:segregation and condensation protein A